MKLVVFPSVDQDRLEQIRKAADTMHVVNVESEDNALAEITDADAFFGKITPKLLSAARQLKWVQSPTASLEHYLFPELIEHPCRLTNMRGLFSDVIADHVMAFVLCFARNLPEYFRRQQAHQWEPVGGEESRTTFASGPGHITAMDRAHQHLGDGTLGVVGVGHIGKEICQRAHAFGMTILGVDPVCRSVPNIVPEVWQPEELPRLLEQSDYVVIAAPHTPATEKLFRSREFQQMKSSAILINIGRGVIVDLADLTSALRNGDIAGAGLDVFEEEPLPQHHPMWDMRNVIITPHVAAASPRIAERHLETLLKNIRRFVRGEELLTPVNKQMWF